MDPMLAMTMDLTRLGPVLLMLLLVTPLAGVAAVAGVARYARRDPAAPRNVALLFSLIGLGLAAGAVWCHLARPAALASPFDWPMELFAIQGFSASLQLSADGISIWLIAMTSVLMPLAILGSAHSIRDRQGTYYGLMLLLQTAMLGVFCARDLIWFYIFFEFTLIPLFFLIAIWGGPLRRRAAYKFFIYTLVGSMLTLAGILWLGAQAGGFGFDRVRSAAAGLSLTVQIVLFAAFFAGFAIKVPLFPLHTWLPLAHTEAPTAGSVILAGVLLKLGTYGFLRIGVDFLPRATIALAPWMGALAVAGILYGALGAWVQRDVKKLVAYSSISHLGFCMLGMFALRPEGLTGSVLVMINHGLSTGALFLVVGMIYERYHTRNMDELGGLGRKMPVISFFLVLFALSSLGLPGLNGFVSEFLVLLGTFVSGQASGSLPATLGIPFAAVAALGVILSAVYLLHMVAVVVFGPLKEPVVHDDPADRLGADANGREWTILVPLGLLVVLLGVWPRPLTRSMAGPVDEILAHVAAASAPADTAGQPVDEGDAAVAGPAYGVPPAEQAPPIQSADRRPRPAQPVELARSPTNH